MPFFPFQHLENVEQNVALFPYAKNEDIRCVVSYMKSMSAYRLYRPHVIMVNTADNLVQSDTHDFQYEFNLIENQLGLQKVKIIRKSIKPLCWIFNSDLIAKAYQFVNEEGIIRNSWMPDFTMYEVECLNSDTDEGTDSETSNNSFTLCFVNADPIFFTKLFQFYLNNVVDPDNEGRHSYGLIITGQHEENVDLFLDVFNQCVEPDFVFTNNQFITNYYENYIQKNDANEEFQFRWKSNEAEVRFKHINKYLKIKDYI
jgi:hypothetical protein